MIALLLLWVGLALAGPVGEGAEAFEQGDLARATELWSADLNTGLSSGRVLFNLGNAWYRRGDHPRAVACFRASQRLRPRDGDVHHNLALARSELGPVPEAAPVPWVWMALLTPGELSLFALLLMVGGSAGALRWRLQPSRTLAVVSLVLVLVAGVLSGLAWEGHGSPTISVVVDDDALVRDAPGAQAGERHRLPPGTEVHLLRRQGEFHLIRDGRGRRGWVPVNAVFSPRP